METENSTRLMCSHDKNYHMEKGKRSVLNPFLARQLSDGMSKAKGEAERAQACPTAHHRVFLCQTNRQTNKQLTVGARRSHFGSFTGSLVLYLSK